MVELGSPTLRAGRDDDAAGYIALISGCWAEYAGCVFDLDGEVPELRALATHAAQCGGRLWTADSCGRVVGMVTVSPVSETKALWRIGKMYVIREFRGGGLARRLMTAAETDARRALASQLDLWTDTRFERAHRFYEKCGFVRTDATRALGDKSHTIEFHYEKPLR